MRYSVRNGYTVFDNIRSYEAGMEIPALISERILKEQGWKIEEIREVTKQEEVKEKVFKDTKNKMVSNSQVVQKGM
jgi:hypothetical protein